jgi:hypothetical protein
MCTHAETGCAYQSLKPNSFPDASGIRLLKFVIAFSGIQEEGTTFPFRGSTRKKRRISDPSPEGKDQVRQDQGKESGDEEKGTKDGVQEPRLNLDSPHLCL